MQQQFRTIGQYIERRVSQAGLSVRSASMELGWGESYLDGVRRGSHLMSLERARRLGRFFHGILQGRLLPGDPALKTFVDRVGHDDPIGEEYTTVNLAAGLPWPPENAAPGAALQAMLAGLDAFALAQLAAFAEYLRTRPSADQDLIDLAAESLAASQLPEPVLDVARRIANLPASLQAKTVSRVSDTVLLIEQAAGLTPEPDPGSEEPG